VEVAVNATCDRERDSLALVDLYNATNGQIWANGWNFADPIDTWFGVGLNMAGCVRSIRLPNNQMQGALPQSIGSLTELEEIWLQFNFIVGPIPDTIENCVLLRDVRLFNNQISGTIPQGFFGLDSLRFVNLARNVIRGAIPANVGNPVYLNYLNLSNNRLEDTIPASIGNLFRLTYFDLANNRLTGSIPGTIGNLTRLQDLNLYQNQLSGEVPQGIFNMNMLQRLWLYSNQLEGSFPDISALPVVSVRIEFNRLEDLPDLTGMQNIGNSFPNGLSVQHNRFTFEDIIPNLPLEARLFDYVPQDSIGERDTVYLFEGNDFVWDLDIDHDIPDNNYKFFRNDTVIRFQNNSDLLVPDLAKRDAGVYTCEVTNFGVPSLVLWAHTMVLVVQDTANCGKPEAGDRCSNAPLVCDVSELDDYCNTLPDTINLTTPAPLCGGMGIPENAQWISFIASDTTMALRIIPSSCLASMTNGVAGMQGAIYDGCNFATATAMACQGSCTEDPFTLRSTNFIPGGTYWLILDGCSGDICDYRIEVLEGNKKFKVPQPVTIFGPPFICNGETFVYSLVDTSEFTEKYIWYTSVGDTVETTTRAIEYTWPGAGDYSMCVIALTACDTTEIYCQDFVVPSKFRAQTVTNICTEDKTGYRTFMDLTGGTPPYSLIAGPGTINQGSTRFLSDTLVNDSSYLFIFQDTIGCTFDTILHFNCVCISDAGVMDSIGLELCDGDTAFTLSLGGRVIEPEDDSLFILHTRPDDTLGTMIAANKRGRFVFDSMKMTLGTTYYASLVVGNGNGNGGVRFSDPCLSVAKGQPVTFYGEAFAEAGVDRTICGLAANLNADLRYGTGQWTICQAAGQAIILNPTHPQSGVEVGESGNYVFCWRSRVGSCTAIDSVSIYFNEPPSLTIGGDTIICSGGEAGLIAMGNFLSYSWSTGDQTRQIRVDSDGTYCVTATDELGCPVSACYELAPVALPEPLITGPQAACDGVETVLQVEGAYSAYRWNTGDTNRVTSVFNSGTYCVTVTEEHGCEGSSCFELGLLPKGVRNIRDTVCYGKTYVNGEISANTTGIHNFELEGRAANGCDSLVLLNLIVLDSLHISDTLIQPDLGNKTGVLSIEVSGGLPPYEIMWNNGLRGRTLIGLEAGPYTAFVTDAKGCTKVFVFVVPRATATKDLAKELSHWRIAPNPAASGQEWLVEWEAFTAGKLNFTVYLMNGSAVWQTQWSYPAGSGSRTLPVDLQPGVYLAEWRSETGARSVHSVIVQ
jgi:Leucine-rich repeat (LRR) protein